jgi:TMEM175 potassium channel family protein
MTGPDREIWTGLPGSRAGRLDHRRPPPAGRREGVSAMPADPDTPRERRFLGKDRMEGFSDGVFGFAATLLVLDLTIHPPGTPLQQVLHAWPGYLAYIVSFLTIGGAWLLHTALTDHLAWADSLFLRLNLLVLLVVVFLPFPTGLVAEALHSSSGERVYVTIYGLTLLAIRLLGSALDAYARHEHLYAPKAEGEELHNTQRKFLPVVIGYVIAILIGLALPVVAVVLYFGIAVYLVVPFREAARVLVRRHSSRQ